MDETLWLGSIQSFERYQRNLEIVQLSVSNGSLTKPKLKKEKLSIGTDSEDSSPSPENFTLFGNVAAIDIAGELTNQDNWYNSYAGLVSYDQIRRGLIEAATHPDVKAIVMNIDSGGGTPNGLPDASDLVNEIRATGMSVVAYTGGMMASAAYWLGSAADKVYAGITADVGSIGVLSIHKEYSKAFKDAGITTTVMRAGTDKALLNLYEKLTDHAKEVGNDRLNTLYDIFLSVIAQHRGVPADYVKENMANGQLFIGQDAMNVGLVDGITTFDNLVTSMQDKINKQANKTLQETNMAKRPTVFTQEQKDQIKLDAGLAIPADVEKQLETAQEPSAEPEVTAAETQTETAAAEAPAVDTSLTDYLRAELKAAQEELSALKLNKNELTTKLAAMETVHEGMKQIVSNSVERLQVHLGMPHMSMSHLPAETLLASHTQLLNAFTKAYPVGGIAAVPTDETKETANEQPLSGIELARIKGNQIQKRT